MVDDRDIRTARCSCGQLAVVVRGNPVSVLICNCRECQKSTGSVFGVSAYWNKEAIQALSGKAVLYRRGSDRGRDVDSYFCPRCGSTVYWYNESNPGFIGILVGNFADPTFEAPRVAYWTASKHPWVTFPEGCRSMPEQP